MGELVTGELAIQQIERTEIYLSTAITLEYGYST